MYIKRNSLLLFQQTMSERLQSHELFRGQPEEVIEITMDGVEKYIMTKLYKV